MKKIALQDEVRPFVKEFIPSREPRRSRSAHSNLDLCELDDQLLGDGRIECKQSQVCEVKRSENFKDRIPFTVYQPWDATEAAVEGD